jgi:butyryl-CoA dehydrogenase
VGQGHKVAFNILNLGRLKLGTRNIGGAKQSLTRAIQYASERRQFGQAIAEFGLIRQKIADMTVRCYVGDAMVYRTLGDVDRALECVDETESERVLKTIESFAVECSINKVWTSEALAFVVDESLQVFGGYGYSKEFPAERAYRDARITRIYEGTNEINRLIISTRLLRNEDVFAPFQQDSLVDDEIFIEETDLLRSAKALALSSLKKAQAKFGDSLAKEQEVLGYISDVIIEVYAMESAILRTKKLIAARGEDACSIQVDVTRVYASDAADRVMHSLKQVAGELFDEPVSVAGPKLNVIAARKRIADAVIRVGRYHL